MKKFILVLGGARSGKSTFAEKTAKLLGDRVLYVATAVVSDVEMQERIERHQRRRPESWRTLESPLNVGAALRSDLQERDVVLIDCLSVLVANVLLQCSGPEAGDVVSAEITCQMEEAVRREVDELMDSYRDSSSTFVVVSNEVGFGVVPPYPLGRAYRDLLGFANQTLARDADEAYLLVAGIPVELKALTRELGTARERETDDSF